MMIKEWLQKFIASAATVTSMIFFWKYSQEKAADARENEIKREEAESLNDAIIKNHQIKANVHEEVNSASDNGKLNELGNKWMRD